MKPRHLLILISFALIYAASTQAQSDTHSTIENKLISAISTEPASNEPSANTTESLEKQVKYLNEQVVLLKQHIGGSNVRVSARNSIDNRLKDLEKQVKDLERRVRKLENLETRLRRVERKL